MLGRLGCRTMPARGRTCVGAATVLRPAGEPNELVPPPAPADDDVAMDCERADRGPSGVVPSVAESGPGGRRSVASMAGAV
jgi:hypothetical protein